MITLDDRRARTALIAAHAAFAKPGHWTRCRYELTEVGVRGIKHRRCLMGEIRHQLGVPVTASPIGARDYELYASVWKWFTHTLGHDPERWNDGLGRTVIQVQGFLEASIAELDAELVKDAPAPPPATQRGRSLVMSIMSLI